MYETKFTFTNNHITMNQNNKEGSFLFCVSEYMIFDLVINNLDSLLKHDT